MKMKRNAKLLGRNIVANPKVCHGQPTFRGTRILAADVLEQVASGMAREAIIEEWNGNITEEAIGEAVHSAAQALLKYKDEFVLRDYVQVNVLDENILKNQRQLLRWLAYADSSELLRRQHATGGRDSIGSPG